MRRMRANFLLLTGGILIGAAIFFVNLQTSKYVSLGLPVDFYKSSIERFLPQILNYQNAHLDLINVSEIIVGPIEQNDKRFINYVLKRQYLLEPTPSDVPYNLSKPEVDPSMGQSSVVKKIFGGMRGGFFIECGALDGETRSNTLALEKNYGWRGLLIEGDPSNYQLVLQKKRKAWTAGCCLAIHPYPHEVIFQQDFNMGKIKSDEGIQRNRSVNTVQKMKSAGVVVQCFPLFTLLSALNVTTVDYFSLDVEGHELEVLKTIPFHLINIKVLSVEFKHGSSGPNGLKSFMKNNGYTVVATVTRPNNLANDFIFVHNSVQTNISIV